MKDFTCTKRIVYYVPLISKSEMLKVLDNIISGYHNSYTMGCGTHTRSVTVESAIGSITISEENTLYKYQADDGLYKCVVCPDLNVNSDEVRNLS